jgi:hypothetical protein
MQATIPVELLELKARFDQWRANRKYKRELIPADLRQAAIDISRRYPRALVRRILKVDPWRLNRPASKKTAPVAGRKKQQTTFFTLPTYAVSPDQGVASSTQLIVACSSSVPTAHVSLSLCLSLILFRSIGSPLIFCGAINHDSTHSAAPNPTRLQTD